jgi:flagellum-specific peptidoglycan hydrolase FlgJ
MGKTKWYAASEDSIPQPGIRKVYQIKQNQRAKPPGRMFRDQPEVPTLAVLFRQILLRVRRNWIALQFQANRYTLGVFRKQTVLKLSTLAVAGYFLLFFEGEFAVGGDTGFSETVTIGPAENYMEVVEKPGGKSLIRREEPTGELARPQKIASENTHATDVAPIGAEKMGQEQPAKYIARYAKIAVQEMHKYGIPASISLAQGLVESRYGTSKLAVRNNNHFGMKCFSKNCRPGHCSNHEDDHHKDFFRKYKTPWESWRAHSLMLANGRYASLKKHGKNYRAWAKGLEQLGYATDPSYSEKLIGVIERYNLQRFDKQ